MKMCQARLILLLAVLIHSYGNAQEENGDFSARLTVFAVVDYAVQHNPEIQAARNRVEALQARIPQAGSLDDPMLGIGALNLPADTAVLHWHRCLPSVLAFHKREDALRFQHAHGGRVMTLAELGFAGTR